MLDVEDVPPLPRPKQTAPYKPLLVRSVFAVALFARRAPYAHRARTV
jgi:hypothetical protein